MFAAHSECHAVWVGSIAMSAASSFSRQKPSEPAGSERRHLCCRQTVCSLRERNIDSAHLHFGVVPARLGVEQLLFQALNEAQQLLHRRRVARRLLDLLLLRRLRPRPRQGRLCARRGAESSAQGARRQAMRLLRPHLHCPRSTARSGCISTSSSKGATFSCTTAG